MKTYQLSEELVTREGVSHVNVDPHEEVVIKVGQQEQIFTGPAIIIINQD